MNSDKALQKMSVVPDEVQITRTGGGWTYITYRGSSYKSGESPETLYTRLYPISNNSRFK